MEHDRTIQLKDGRQLGYAEYGVPSGFPVMYFHGGNGSRLEAKWFENAAQEQGVRLIAPDRPGFGLSDFQANRRLLDWTSDVTQLADALHLETFSIFGLSGGGPHVAVIAYALPERLHRAAIVSGTTPPNIPGAFKGLWLPLRMMFFMAKHLPGLQRMMLKQMGKFYADPEQMKKRMLQALPAPDKALIAKRPEIIEIFSADAREAHRNGIDGDAQDWQIYVQPWGFEVRDITMEIGLWFGEVDANVPIAMGEYFARELLNNQYHVVPDGGHFSTINNYIDDILAYLKA